MLSRPFLMLSAVPAIVLAGALVPTACGNPSDSGRPEEGSNAPGSVDCPPGPERNGPYTPVTVHGETAALGIFDPSVEYAEEDTFGLMTYTAVPSRALVHTAVAASEDGGASWHYVDDVTRAAATTITTTDLSVCGSFWCDGTFVHESSSLVLDRFDPDPDRRLKVFVHSYFFFGVHVAHLQLGYLAMYTAGSPEGPWTETRLLGWPSSSPVSTTDVAYDISTDPALAGLHECLIVAEPGALVRSPGVIDLALACVKVSYEDGSSTIDVRLLRSTDHGWTWSYVGTLLAPEDARSLGATVNEINGADLFFANDAYHLIATPIGPVHFPEGWGRGYRGCVVVRVADIESGRVARCNGAPVVEASYLGQPGQFVGACSGDVGASASGMLIPVADLASPQPFQMFASGPPVLP